MDRGGSREALLAAVLGADELQVRQRHRRQPVEPAANALEARRREIFSYPFMALRGADVGPSICVIEPGNALRCALEALL